jgi:esterase/lipase superfamily enzyme
MRRDYRRWYSPRLHREMELLIFGHAGAKVLMFPTRDGRFFEYEKLNIVASLAEKVEAGCLQLFCIEGLARESFYDVGRHPAERVRRHSAFESYILDEVLPLMAWTNPHDCTIAMGCSLGAFQAASLVFRHPHLFRKLVALSGRYDLTIKVECFGDLFDGYYNDDIYFYTPTHFLPGLTCPGGSKTYAGSTSSWLSAEPIRSSTTTSTFAGCSKGRTSPIGCRSGMAGPIVRARGEIWPRNMSRAATPSLAASGSYPTGWASRRI